MTDGSTWTDSLRRRRFLRTTGAISAGAFGGCLDGGGEVAEPSIDVPESRLLDRSIEVSFADLPSGERVTVTAETTNPATDEPWTAEATFEVGPDGRLELAESTPVEGDYASADPMGLVLGMEADASPARTAFPLASHDVDVSVRRPDGETPLATATTSRTLPEVETEPFEDDVVGRIHLPPDRETAPGIVLLHGSGGEPLHSTARLFAANGFVAGSIQYFGRPGPLPDDLIEVPLEIVDSAASQLLSHDRVAGEAVGVYGRSKGGELSLLAGTHLDTVGAVACLAGSGIVWEGLTASWRPGGASSWSIDGEPVPYVPISGGGSDVGDVYATSFENADGETVEAATIPVERADARLLAVSGTRDGVWNASDLVDLAFDRLDGGGPTADHRQYEDAGHWIRPPFLPTYGTTESRRLSPGGTRAGNAAASRDHWPRVRSLFEERLGN